MIALPGVEETRMPATEIQELETQQARTVHAAEITVESGILWVTQSGRIDDIVLHAGQSYCPSGQGKVVIQAIEGKARAVFVLYPRDFASVLRRWRAALIEAIEAIGSGPRPDPERIGTYRLTPFDTE
jgi:hypothetical protein